MSEPIPTDQVEQLVGARRHPTHHLARADSEAHQIYVLHPQTCLEIFPDLRQCPHSEALDYTNPSHWIEDVVTTVSITVLHRGIEKLHILYQDAEPPGGIQEIARKIPAAYR